MAAHIDRWNTLLPGAERDEDGWSAPQDISKWSDYLLFDLLGDLCFGMKFDTKEPGENKLKAIPHFIAEYMKVSYPVHCDLQSSIFIRSLTSSPDCQVATSRPGAVAQTQRLGCPNRESHAKCSKRLFLVHRRDCDKTGSD